MSGELPDKPSSDETPSKTFSLKPASPSKSISAKPASRKPGSGKASSSKPSSGKSPSGKSKSGKPPTGKSKAVKKSSGKKSLGKKSSGRKSSSNGGGRGIEHTVILETGGLVEAHWQLESSKRGNRHVPYSMRSVATQDQSVDPIMSVRDPSVDPIMSIRGGFDDTMKDEVPSSGNLDKKDDNKGRGCWRTHKKCLIIGFVLFLIVDFILLGLFLGPGFGNKGTASSSSENADPSDGDTVVGVPEDSPNAAPSVDVPDDAPNAAPSDNNVSPEAPEIDVTTPTITEPVPDIGESEDDTSPPTIGPTDGQSGTLNPIPDDFSFPGDDDSGDDSLLAFTKVGKYQLLETVPHDASAWTQGLEILSHDKIDIMKEWHAEVQIRGRRMLRPGCHRRLVDSSAYMLESTGQYGTSQLRIVHLEMGQVVQEFDLEAEYFGEGLTYYSVADTDADGNDVVRIVQLTWKENRGFVYELSIPESTTPVTRWSLNRIGEFAITDGDDGLTGNGKAWGIVFLPIRNQFIVGDGTRFLYVWELTETTTGLGTVFSFEKKYRVTARDKRDPEVDWYRVSQINEMEWDPYSYGGNTILANIWKSDEIVRIWVGGDRDESDPNEGKITHFYDVSDLKILAGSPSDRGAVLNGIAFVYDSASEYGGLLQFADQFWVTGKLWPSMFRIKLIDDD